MTEIIIKPRSSREGHCLRVNLRHIAFMTSKHNIETSLKYGILYDYMLWEFNVIIIFFTYYSVSEMFESKLWEFGKS